MFKVQILRDRCKGCGLCVLFCKEKALCISSKINELGYFPAEPTEEGECVGCQNCYLMCPESIIEISQEKQERVNESIGN